MNMNANMNADTSMVGTPSTVRSLISTARLELIPLKSLDAAIDALPAHSRVSVTCSPAKGIDATLTLAARLQDLGHNAVPHISARLITGADNLRAIVDTLGRHELHEIFLIAGDAEHPAGPYDGVVALLRDLLTMHHGLTHIGVTAYPDGHPLISGHTMQAALLRKQELLHEAGIAAHATTQMCFDTTKVHAWIRSQRSAGVTVPIHLGLPGVVDRTKLLTLGARLGIGQSLRFVRKNAGSVRGLLFSTGYDPSTLIDTFAKDAESLGIDGVHLFTFNEIANTVAWQRSALLA
jgi:methylenetetrahydrofolate reductase (NADPH)